VSCGSSDPAGRGPLAVVLARWTPRRTSACKSRSRRRRPGARTRHGDGRESRGGAGRPPDAWPRPPA
jgi:hypothetical protein